MRLRGYRPQNLGDQCVAGKILISKSLAFGADYRATLTRGFMIEQDDGCAQGQMSQG